MVTWPYSLLAGRDLGPSRAPGHSLFSLPCLAALAGGHHELSVVLRDRRCHRGLVSLRLHCFRSRWPAHLCASPTARVRVPLHLSVARRPPHDATDTHYRGSTLHKAIGWVPGNRKKKKMRFLPSGSLQSSRAGRGTHCKGRGDSLISYRRQ